MCAGCAAGAEAAVWQAAAGVVVARDGLTRLRERANGSGRAERRRAAYQADARFLAGLGLDPARVLGPPPSRGTDAGG